MTTDEAKTKADEAKLRYEELRDRELAKYGGVHLDAETGVHDLDGLPGHQAVLLSGLEPKVDQAAWEYNRALDLVRQCEDHEAAMAARERLEAPRPGPHRA